MVYLHGLAEVELGPGWRSSGRTTRRPVGTAVLMHRLRPLNESKARVSRRLMTYERASAQPCPTPIEVTFVKLPAVVTGGSVATSTGLLALHLPPLVMGPVVLAELAAFAWYTWSVTRRQQQAQQSALNLVRELRDARVSVVVRADGQVEIQPQPVAAEPVDVDAIP